MQGQTGFVVSLVQLVVTSAADCDEVLFEVGAAMAAKLDVQL